MTPSKLALVICLSLSSGAPGAATLYGLDHLTNELVSIDETTGSVTSIGPLGFDASGFSPLDYNPYDGKLYTMASIGTNAALYSIDRVSGASTLHTTFNDIGIGALGFLADNSALMYWEKAGFVTGTLYKLDLATLAKTQIGTSGTPSMLGGDYGLGGYWASDEWTGKIYKLNPLDASIMLQSSTPIYFTGNGPGDLFDMDISSDGTIRVVGSGDPSVIINVDQLTGLETSRVSMNRNSVVAIATVPEPSTMILSGLTIFGCCFRRKR